VRKAREPREPEDQREALHIYGTVCTADAFSNFVGGRGRWPEAGGWKPVSGSGGRPRYRYRYRQR
jgi:hypothetical protein